MCRFEVSAEDLVKDEGIGFADFADTHSCFDFIKDMSIVLLANPAVPIY